MRASKQKKDEENKKLLEELRAMTEGGLVERQSIEIEKMKQILQQQQQELDQRNAIESTIWLGDRKFSTIGPLVISVPALGKKMEEMIEPLSLFS